MNSFDVCEAIRVAVLDCMDAAPQYGEYPISTSYTGAGQLAWDDCCGTLVVTPVRTFRSVIFPNESFDEEMCDTGMVVVDVMVTLVRCVPTLDDSGNPPSAASLQQAHAALLADASTIWCCVSAPLPDEPTTGEWERAQVRQEVVGGEGGCVSVETRFLLGTPAFMWCCPPDDEEP